MAGEFGEGKVAPEQETTREELYKQYHEQNGTPPVEEKKEEVAEPAPVEAAKPEEAKEAVESEVKEPLKKEQTQVPYGALHEERLKRQAEAKARKEAEDRANALEDELARLKTHESQADEITDYEKEILELKRFRQAQENLERQRQEKEKQDAEEKAKNNFWATMDKIDKDLFEEGYGGFKLSLRAVEDELNSMILQDESNRSLDNEEGLKQIYKERVHPKAAKIFADAQQKREKAGKEELKKQANIHTPPGGKPPTKPKSVEDMTESERHEAYLKLRRGE